MTAIHVELLLCVALIFFESHLCFESSFKQIVVINFTASAVTSNFLGTLPAVIYSTGADCQLAKYQTSQGLSILHLTLVNL